MTAPTVTDGVTGTAPTETTEMDTFVAAINTALEANYDDIQLRELTSDLPTIGQTEAETGTSSARRVFTALRVSQAITAAFASPNLTGVPTAPTASTSTDTTQIASTAFVQAVAAALLDSPPATLNTLNKLAAALGDDANFATTMTTALGAKADLASPDFTGAPTAPTASTSTDTNQIASTAFVQAVAAALLAVHATATDNPHSVTATQVGLANVDNTSDSDKPLSTATQAALDVALADVRALTNTTLNGLTIRGGFDASGSTFPNATLEGHYYVTNVAGTVDGITFAVYDRLIAVKNSPSITTFAGNWIKVADPNGGTGSLKIEDFGALGGGANDAGPWEAAMDFIEANAGKAVIDLVPGKAYHFGKITVASDVTVNMNGATMLVHSSTPKTGSWLQNRNPGTDKRIKFVGPGKMDGSARLFDRWLSKLNGTAVTDPEADYVMGTGALASGITGVDLTSVLTAGVVTSVTIVDGGSGWNGHSTVPYLSDEVQLLFEGGGGEGASGFATIVAGTIDSVTISNGGSGYTSVPTCTTRGGYADIEWLKDPSIDRRHPDYAQSGNGLTLHKVDSPSITDIDFVGFHCRAVVDLGCDSGFQDGNSFTDCGKLDGPFHCVWVQSSGNIGDTGYAPSRKTVVKRMKVFDAERSAIMFSPHGGGVLSELDATGCGESTIYIGNTANSEPGSSILIENCTLADNTQTDIAAAHIEHLGVHNLTVRNVAMVGSSGPAIGALGCKNVVYDGCRLTNNGTALTTTGDMRVPYGPFSEREAFGSGTRPVCGNPLVVADESLIDIGTYGAVPSENVTFMNNTILEDRTIHPKAVFIQKKLGTNNIGGTTNLVGNNVTQIPAAMAFLNTDVGNVWSANMPLFIRDNAGHESEAPKRIDHQFNATGGVEFNVGFRPSRVDVVADVNNFSRMRASSGTFTWDRTGVRTDFTHTFSSDGTQVEGFISNNDVIRTRAPDGVSDINVVEFVRWTETGFVLNCQTYGELLNARFVCTP